MLLTLISNCNFVGYAYAFEVFDEITKIDAPDDKITVNVQTTQIFGFCISVNPYKGRWNSVSFKNESVRVVPNSNDMFSIVNGQFLRADGEESFDTWRFVNLYISY